MNPEQPTPSPKKRIFLVIGIGVVVLVASFALTVLVLKEATPKKANTETSSSLPSSTNTSNIDQVLSSYPEAIASFKNEYQPLNSSQDTVYYKQSDKAYQISILTSKNVTFVATTPNKTSASLPSEVTSFFTSRGFTQQSDQAVQTKTMNFLTYTSKDAACQVSMTVPSSTTVQVVTLGCVPIADISKEYTFVNQLLSLYTKNNPKPDFTQESRNLVISDNKSLSIVRLMGGSTEPTLLFAAIDNKWEYIATLSTGDSTESNGKYVPSTDLTTALNNPKYGDFLKNNIQ